MLPQFASFALPAHTFAPVSSLLSLKLLKTAPIKWPFPIPELSESSRTYQYRIGLLDTLGIRVHIKMAIICGITFCENITKWLFDQKLSNFFNGTRFSLRASVKH